MQLLGDNIYDSGVTSVTDPQWQTKFEIPYMGVNLPFYVVLGNHDYGGNGAGTEFDKALRDSVPGAGFSYTQPIEMNTNDLLAGIHSDVAVHLYGYDPVQLRLTSDKILRRLKEIPGAKDVHAEQIAGSTTLNLNIDRVAVGRAGIDASRVLDAVSAIGGVRVVDVLYKNVPTAIQVRFSKATRADRESVLSVPVKTNTATGTQVGATFTLAGAPQGISTLITADGSRAVLSTAGTDPTTGTVTHRIAVLDIRTGTQVGATVTVIGTSLWPLLSADGSRALITTVNIASGTSTRVAVINTTTGAQIGATVNLTGAPSGPPVLRADGSRVLVTTYDSTTGTTRVTALQVT